jgi:lysophospholipase L1-like esterase
MNPSEVIAMRILCFGDSNTYGYDPRGFFGDSYGAEDRWVDLLAEQTGWEMINAGANGREIPRESYALRLLAEHTPLDIFLVMLGTNDLLQGASAKEAATRMEAFLNQLLPHCKQLLLICPPPMKRGAWVPTDELVTESVLLAKEYHVLAEKLNIPFVDTHHWNIELTFDGVHFTEDGHHAFAENLRKELCL